MTLIHSHYYGRVLLATCAATAGITMIGILTQLFTALGDERLSGLSVFDFMLYMALKIPQVVAIVIPACVFVGTLMTLNAARTDNEITCLQATGVPFWTLAGIGVPPVVVVAIVQMLLNCLAIPYCNITTYNLLRTNAIKALAGVVGGTFVSPLPGLTVRYDQTRGNAYSGVFANYDDGDNDTTYIARRALLRDEDSLDIALVMYDGAIMSVGENDTAGVLAFDQYTLNLSGLIDESQFAGRRTDTLYIHQLFDHAAAVPSEPVSQLRAEGHYRISLPLLTPFLSLLAGLGVVGARVSRRHFGWRVSGFCAVGLVILVLPHMLSELVRSSPDLIWMYYAVPIVFGTGLVLSHMNADSNRPPK